MPIPNASSAGGPRVPRLLTYCSTFLKPEMLHVYRQVTAIDQFKQWVVTRNRQNAPLFPFEPLFEIRKSRLRGLRRACYRLFRLPVPLDRSETRQLLDWAKDLEIDVFHAYLGTEAARLIDFLKQVDCARVVSFHGNDLSDSLSARDFARLLQHTELFLVRSASLRHALLERGCPPERIRLNRTGVPIPGTVAPIELPTGEIRLLQACRFIDKKGLDVSLQAIALLRQQGLNIRLDLAGGGPEEASLRELASKLGIAEAIGFLGFLPNPELLARLSGYHAFLHPSRTTDSGDREGIPNALLEAMAYGLPVVSTRHSGIPEVVRDGENGYLIPHADPTLLATAISRLFAGDAAHFASLSQAARQTVIEQYSTAANRDSLQASYHEALHLAARRRSPLPATPQV